MQQLPGADSIFLAMETPTLFMHTGALTILEPQAAPGLGFARLRETVAERIVQAPRFTQRLREVPLGLDRPYLVSDPDFDVARHLRSRTGKADVGRVDPQLVDQVEDLDLLVARRAADGGRLQSIPQRLVVEHDDRPRRRRRLIPVVDQGHGGQSLAGFFR